MPFAGVQGQSILAFPLRPRPGFELLHGLPHRRRRQATGDAGVGDLARLRQFVQAVGDALGIVEVAVLPLGARNLAQPVTAIGQERPDNGRRGLRVFAPSGQVVGGHHRRISAS